MRGTQNDRRTGRISITLPPDLMADIRRAARERKVGVSEHIVDIIKAWYAIANPAYLLGKEK